MYRTRTEFLVATNHFRHFYSDFFHDVDKEIGLSQLEADILLFLKNNPDYNTAKDIVELRGFAKSNVSTALESLRAEGYVTMQTVDDNRRMRRIFLNSEKDEEIEKIVDCQKKCLDVMFSGFTQKDMQQLEDCIKRMEKNIDDID